MEEIHIYHTNDLHSHFENWPRIHELILKRKIWHEEKGDSVLIFDIGDHLDLWHPNTEATQGKINTQLLNEAHYTAVTIGNNEGITLSHESLDSLYDDASFDVLIANLYKSDGSRPNWAKPYKIYKTKNGIKIGVIGLSVPFYHLYDLLGWKVSEPFEELKKQLNEIRNEVDIVILLSHLGIQDDELIASKFPEIDLILGAHTHHVLQNGKVINNNLLGAAGKYGYFVGHVTLAINSTTRRVEKQKAILYHTKDLPPTKGENEIVSQLINEGKTLLSTEIVNLSKVYSKQELSTMLCETLQNWTNADCAFLNEGLILNDLNKGSVTLFDLLNICPHPINPCVVQLSGKDLIQVLTETMNDKWTNMQIKGLGFRGTIMGRIIYNGITKLSLGSRADFLINNEEIDCEKVYKLAIPDMFTFGYFFPPINRALHKTYYLPEFMRHLLKWTLEKKQL